MTLSSCFMLPPTHQMNHTLLSLTKQTETMPSNSSQPPPVHTQKSLLDTQHSPISDESKFYKIQHYKPCNWANIPFHPLPNRPYCNWEISWAIRNMDQYSLPNIPVIGVAHIYICQKLKRHWADDPFLLQCDHQLLLNLLLHVDSLVLQVIASCRRCCQIVRVHCWIHGWIREGEVLGDSGANIPSHHQGWRIECFEQVLGVRWWRTCRMDAAVVLTCFFWCLMCCRLRKD